MKVYNQNLREFIAECLGTFTLVVCFQFTNFLLIYRLINN